MCAYIADPISVGLLFPFMIAIGLGTRMLGAVSTVILVHLAVGDEEIIIAKHWRDYTVILKNRIIPSQVDIVPNTVHLYLIPSMISAVSETGYIFAFNAYKLAE